ncbi:NAD(P)-binding protein [Pyrenochaeta sp. DS3sAY3a]|nr:NAD(P)-binding protein [Pyrenochaeta sp. DS3sAY3a]
MLSHRTNSIVVLVDINRSELEETNTSLVAKSYKAHSFICDVSSDSDVRSLISDVIENVGIPDIVHNNAVFIRSGNILNLSLEDSKRMFDVNALGYLRIIQGFAPPMITRGQGGWFANTVSPNGIMPANPAIAELANYSLCKAADISLSMSAAMTLRLHGIGVSILFPDVVYPKSVHELSGPASQEFKDGFVNFITAAGAPSGDVAKKLMQGVKERRFFVNAAPGFEGQLKLYAEHLLDPNVHYDALQANP